MFSIQSVIELAIHPENKSQTNGTAIPTIDKKHTSLRFKRENYENYTEKVVQMGDEARFPCNIEKENLTVSLHE